MVTTMKSVARGSTRGLVRRVTHWHVDSQQRARRNALTASTLLLERRLERDEVEEFLERHQRRFEARQAHALRALG